MPRCPRDTQPGCYYHLISRLVDRDWFISSDEERRQYLELYGRAVSESDWRALNFAVMSNHMHHMLVAGAMPLDTWLRRAHAPFADWLNVRYARIGPIFVRGPKQLRVEPGRVAHAMAYIHNNPVRAGVAPEAKLSGWTSHRAYLGLEPAPAWLSVEAGLALAGFATGADFDAFVKTPSSDPDRDRLLDPLLVRDLDVRADFHVPAPVGVDAAAVVAATCQVVGMELSWLCSRRRTRWHVFARQVAVLAAEQLRVPGARIALALGLSQQGSSWIAQQPVTPEVREAAERVVACVRGDARRAA